MKTKIVRLDHKGMGIGYVDGKVVFIDSCLTDEEVECQIVLDKKKYMQGKLIKVNKESEFRVKPICPYYDVCGGCNIMHMDYKKQLEYKKNKVADILLKYASLKNCVKEIVPSDDLYYRNKITLKVKGKIGLYEKNSNDIVNIKKCFISNNNINKIIDILSKIEFDSAFEIIIKANSTNEIMVAFDKNVSSEVIDILKNQVSSIYVCGECIYGDKYITQKMGDYKFAVSPKSFFQVNTKQALNMYLKVLSYCNLSDNDIVLDLFCGTGTIGIFLSKHCKKVIGIEINKSSIEDAYVNAGINNVSNIEFLLGDVSKLLKDVIVKPDVIVVDPPRSGLDNKAVDLIMNFESRKIVYVSCDPMTLARDINALSKKYSVLEVTPFDMFPNTYHVECVCLLELKK